MERAHDHELELRDYLQVLRSRKWTIATTAVAVVAVALMFSLLQSKAYRATAEVLLESRTSEQIFSPADQQATGSRYVDTEIQVMNSRVITDAVGEALGRPPAVSISAIDDTNVVAISATHSDPQVAAREVNTYAEVYIETRREALIRDLLDAAAQVQSNIADLDSRLAAIDAAAEAENLSTSAERQAILSQRAAYSQQLGQLELARNLTRSGGAQFVSPAAAPTSPIRPTPRRNVAFGAVLGVMLGIGAAFLRNYLDDSLRTSEDFGRVSGLPVLGVIPSVPGWKRQDEPRIAALDDPTSATSEAYRSLRTALQFLSLDRPMDIVQVTSPSAGDGKTTTVVNLAVALGMTGRSVLIVDGDLRRPRTHEFFGVKNTIGLTSVLVGDLTLEEALQQPLDGMNISLLASGPLPPNPSELLASQRAARLFDSLRDVVDIVLVDSAPVLPVTDGVVLAGIVDSTIVVATARRATRHDVRRAVEALRLVDAPLIGGIVNQVHQRDGYGYSYGYADPERGLAGTVSRPWHRRPRVRRTEDGSPLATKVSRPTSTGPS